MIVGILGGGQLARMLALAGHPLGMDFIVLDPAEDACAAAVAMHLHGAYDDPELLAELAALADVITYEFENVPASAVEYLTQHCEVYPAARALAVAQDRLNEKTTFAELGIPTPPFAAINTLDELHAAMATIGYPAVLKTRREGYDGKGQAVLRGPDDLAAAWARLGGVAAIVEGFVPFTREISVLAVRDRDGHTACYPITENTHVDGILRQSIARPGDATEAQAHGYITRLLDHLGYVGVMALEIFQVGDTLLANECAPRVHNTGHWTQNGADTSQFENHLRAITGLPLGGTAAIGHAAMVNLIGNSPTAAEVLAHPHCHLHLYDKEPRPGRKIGHVNIRADDRIAFATTLQHMQTLAEQHIS